MRILLILFLMGYGAMSMAQKTGNILYDAPFLRHKAAKGDNGRSVMQWYGLDSHPCNMTQFLKLNKLKNANQTLEAGKWYPVPIQTVRYNGASIRTTLGIENWKLAVQIRDFNTQAQAKGARTDDFTESKVLWVPWYLVNCDDKQPAKTAPNDQPKTKAAEVEVGGGELGGEPTAKGKSRNYPIFGEKHAQTPLLSSKFKGRVFYLVSGHGGPDPGARGKRAGVTLCEDEYAYDVTLRLLRYLISHGATAYMIVRDPNDGIRDDNYLKCDKDEVVWGNQSIPENQKNRLRQRTDIINALTEIHEKKGVTDQTVVEIHVDSRSVATETDVFFYYRPNDEASLNLALHIHQVFIEKYNQKRGPARRYSGTVTARDLFTLRETSTKKAVYVELANIQNDWDQQRIVLKNNRQAIANWIGLALAKK